MPLKNLLVSIVEEWETVISHKLKLNGAIKQVSASLTH